MQGILSFLQDGDNSQKVPNEYKQDMYYNMQGPQGRASGRLSSLQRGMRSFRGTTDHLEFRTVDDVEGRMEIHSSLTESFK